MARQAVLKQFLKGSGSAKERARSVSETKEPTASEISWKELLAWRIRGALWFATFLFSLVGCVLGESLILGSGTPFDSYMLWYA